MTLEHLILLRGILSCLVKSLLSHGEEAIALVNNLNYSIRLINKAIVEKEDKEKNLDLFQDQALDEKA